MTAEKGTGLRLASRAKEHYFWGEAIMDNDERAPLFYRYVSSFLQVAFKFEKAAPSCMLSCLRLQSSKADRFFHRQVERLAHLADVRNCVVIG